MEGERDQAVTAKMAEDVPKPWLWTYLSAMAL